MLCSQPGSPAGVRVSWERIGLKLKGRLGYIWEPFPVPLFSVSKLIQAALFLLTALIGPYPLAFLGTCFLSICDQNMLAGLSEGIVPVSASWCGDMGGLGLRLLDLAAQTTYPG